ncbi:MAG: glycosyltransferase family 2 protein, partial [Myxococcales bacterium]|nr:glycosyltransferase family 2 protein [Myxococcales bacterium]
MAKPTARRRKKQKRGSGPSAGRRRRLSLCMIVRDEAELLPHCLRSVQGVVDEIIIVDTGSIDDTVAIAEAAGAKVLSHAWTGDFAAARNASLAEASGDFVLVLDADEQLTKGAGVAIRRAMRDGGFDCGFLPLHNASSREASHAAVVAGEAAASEVLYLPRLLRKVGDLRYRGIIHESVGQWLKQRGSKPRFVEGADIVHYGYVREVSADKKKRDRNVALLEQACREHPEAVSNHGYLALAFA